MKYDCNEVTAGSNTIESVTKSVYKEILCESGSHNINYTINENSNVTEIASMEFDCTDDLATEDTNTDDIDSDNENVISLHAICDLEPPGERDLYLAIGQCFLLSNKTITEDVTNSNGTITGTRTYQQALWAQLDCEFASKTNFVTYLYKDNACINDADITRSIPLLECETWLFENETDFGFDIQASVKIYLYIDKAIIIYIIRIIAIMILYDLNRCSLVMNLEEICLNGQELQ